MRRNQTKKDAQLELFILKLNHYEQKIDILTQMVQSLLTDSRLEDRTLTLPEALVALHMTRATFLSKRKAGLIRCVEGIGRRVLVKQSEIDAYLNKVAEGRRKGLRD